MMTAFHIVVFFTALFLLGKVFVIMFRILEHDITDFRPTILQSLLIMIHAIVINLIAIYADPKYYLDGPAMQIPLGVPVSALLLTAAVMAFVAIGTSLMIKYRF